MRTAFSPNEKRKIRKLRPTKSHELAKENSSVLAHCFVH